MDANLVHEFKMFNILCDQGGYEKVNAGFFHESRNYLYLCGAIYIYRPVT